MAVVRPYLIRACGDIVLLTRPSKPWYTRSYSFRVKSLKSLLNIGKASVIVVLTAEVGHDLTRAKRSAKASSDKLLYALVGVYSPLS